MRLISSRLLSAAFVSSLLSFTALNCGQKPDPSPDAAEDNPLLDLAPLQHQLLFTEIDVASNDWKTSLHSMNDKHEIKTLSSGESMDTALFQVGNEVLFFNRAKTINVRALTANSDQSWDIGAQESFSGGKSGDPHAAIDIGSGHILLAQYVAGSLSIIDRANKDITLPTLNWGLPEGTPFHPENLFSVHTNAGDRVLVVHQGSELKGGKLIANGTQKIFVLAKSAGTVASTRSDNTVESIPLKGSFPSAILCGDHSSLTIVGVCGSMAADDQACKSSIETLDIATLQITSSWDLSKTGLYMNGAVTCGEDAEHIYMSVVDRDGMSHQRMVHVDLKAQKFEDIYNYGMFGGWFGAFFDETTKELFVGDATSDSKGAFTVFKGSTKETTIALDYAPYSGVVVNTLSR